jgi:hypothetical protein
MTQECPSEFLLTVSGIQHRIPRRTFQRIRLSPNHLPLRVGAFTRGVMTAQCSPVPDSSLRDRLRPFALPCHYPWPWVVVTPPATTASLPLC